MPQTTLMRTHQIHRKGHFDHPFFQLFYGNGFAIGNIIKDGQP